MSDFVYDPWGSKVWYDLKLKNYTYDCNNATWFVINHLKQDEYYVRLHNENGPAVIYDNGGQEYFIKGKLHREDGPASILPFSLIKWYLNDLRYSFDDWCKELNKSEEEINFLKLKWNIV